MLLADIHILYRSDFYQVVDYKCHCTVCSVSDREYNGSFNISFIRQGFFEYRTFRRKDEIHAGRILISKPGYEHTTMHIDNHPDITTTIEFKKSFFDEMREKLSKNAGWFFANTDIHSVMIYSSAELEYLHFYILNKIKTGHVDALGADERVISLLQKIIDILGNNSKPEPLADTLKKHHLVTIDTAKNYILNNFHRDISLQELARHCNVSPFHFSRIFKSVLNTAPHQYLSSVRLNHAKILLETTSKPVTDIAFDCGFNSLEHFAGAYKKHFSVTPSRHRAQIA